MQTNLEPMMYDVLAGTVVCSGQNGIQLQYCVKQRAPLGLYRRIEVLLVFARPGGTQSFSKMPIRRRLGFSE